MGRSRYQMHNPQGVYFLTCTINQWVPIFTRPATVEILLDSFRYLQDQHALKLYGYVILENHLHWIASSPDLAKDVARFKSYTAKMILRYLEERGQYRVLQQFAFHKRRHKRDCVHQFWEEGSHPQEIQGDEMMRQKLEYIHLNPVKRGYVDLADDWRYSSARNYEGRDGLLEVVTQW